jgi:glutamate N-acetyltransferase/amino-acid N-acetyltransferase
MDICGGRIVGIAKGAGMVEPDMATMLSYILTDLSVPREILRRLLKEVVNETFNSMSIDTDQSTSDTVAILSSDQIPFDPNIHLEEFKQALQEVCTGLCEDIVRNGEGAQHVMRVNVRGAISKQMAKGVGKSVINSPLLKCAVAGNDPNVGRLVMAVGKYMGKYHKEINITQKMKIRMGGVIIFENGEFMLNGDIEHLLVDHMRQAQLTGKLKLNILRCHELKVSYFYFTFLYSIESTRGGLDVTSRDYPPHGHFVEVSTLYTR